MPATSAASLTGEKENSCPRPRPRSGCVTTARTLNSGSASSCCREGTANAGVPQKTTFSISSGGLPLACLLQLADFSPNHVALQHAQMAQEQNSVEMVNFMAEGPRQ